MRDHNLARKKMVIGETVVSLRVIGIVIIVVEEGPLPDP